MVNRKNYYNPLKIKDSIQLNQLELFLIYQWVFLEILRHQ